MVSENSGEEKTLYIKELNCEACDRLVRKIAQRHSVSVSGVDFQKKEAKVAGSAANIDEMMAALESMGYSSSFDKIPSRERHMERFFAYARGAVFGGDLFAAESKAFEVALYSFVLLMAITIALAFTHLLAVPMFYASLSAFSISLLAGVSWHVLAYRNYFTHMNGMMVGMGVGMGAGFLIGALAGATNGMFTGSVVGMAAGMALGAFLGMCCGVMGVLEGLMGGLMAGTMGAMLSVMMQFDHLNEFLALLFASFTAILVGLDYMVYKENQGQSAQKPSVPVALLLAAATQLLVLLVVIYAPHSSGVVISR